MSTKMIRIGLLALAALAVASCSRQATGEGKPVLAVSIEPQRAILEELAGDNFDIVTALPAGANPEVFDPTVAQRMAMADAKAYFTIGYLPFEKTLAAEAERTIDSSVGIVPIMGSHSHGDHVHAEADPHVWTSLKNGRVIAANMAKALAELDPANAQAYADRLSALTHRLDSTDAAVIAKLAAAPSRSFAVWHPSLSYFARDYSLRQIAVGQESKETSPAVLTQVIGQAKADSVRVFFYQKAFDSRQASSLNAEIGSRLVEVNPMAADWENEITRIADELAK